MHFKYQKEVARLVFGERKDTLGQKMLNFSKQWMKFVMSKCERGRGTRPRYGSLKKELKKGKQFLSLPFWTEWIILRFKFQLCRSVHLFFKYKFKCFFVDGQTKVLTFLQ